LIIGAVRKKKKKKKKKKMFERKNPQHAISEITYGYQPLIHSAITRLKLRGHTTACIFSSQRDAIKNQHEDISREIESRLISSKSSSLSKQVSLF
jgi:hypothetical protein